MGDAGRDGVEPGRPRRARITASGSASVAMSMSATGRPRSAFRTQPPTGSAWCPAAVSAPQTACVAGASSQGASMRVTAPSTRSDSAFSIRAVAPQM